MGKADDSRRTIKYPQKSGMRNLAKATNENSMSFNASNNASKKASDVKEMRLPIKKQSKQHLL